MDKTVLRQLLRHESVLETSIDSDDSMAVYIFTILLNAARVDFEFSNISEFIAHVLGADSGTSEDLDSEAEALVDGADLEVSVGAAAGSAGNSSGAVSPKQYWKDLATFSASSAGFLLGLARVRLPVVR